MQAITALARWLAAAALCAAAGAAPAVTLTLACDAVGLSARVCQEGAQQWASRHGHTVKLVPVPRSSTRRLELYKQLLDARSDAVDIYMIDIVWPGILARSFVDLSVPARAVLPQHFPSIVANNTVDGRLIAMPWFTDAGLLFYRKDLLARHGLPVPRSWGELERAARIIQDAERQAGKRGFWGYVWQGKAYEGLTCNVIEWLAASGGGAVLDRAGRATIDNPGAVDALQRARAWIGAVSPPAVLDSDEDSSLAAFSAGQAAFMRNWPYAWALSNGAGSAVRGQVGIAALPSGAGALGGQQLAVSRFSRHPAEAIDLVMYLTGRAEQKRRALVLGVNPTVMELYSDPEVRAIHPYQATIRDAVAAAVRRPSGVAGERYEEVSRALSHAARSVLAEGKDAASSVKTLARTLDRSAARER